MWDQEAHLQKHQTSTSWGPFESMHIIAKGHQKLRELQAKTDIVLRGFVQNHLLSFRPDAQGQLRRFAFRFTDLYAQGGGHGRQCKNR